MNEKTLLESLGATSIEDAYRIKQSEKQVRMFSIRKPQVVQLTADECKALCDVIGVNYVPGYEQRVMQYIVSNEVKDRYGDIVRAAGAKLENYMRNPVMFFGHNYSTPPIGNSVKVWVDKDGKQVMSWGLFADDNVDKSGLADLIFRFAQSGFMRACSVGFQPEQSYRPESQKESEKMGLGKHGVEYRIWDMLEWSPCGIPANPTALQCSLKDVGKRLVLDQHHIEAAEKYRLFTDVNMLDMLVEGLKPPVTHVAAPMVMTKEYLKIQARDTILTQLETGMTTITTPALTKAMLDEMPIMLEEGLIALVNDKFVVIEKKDVPEDIVLHPYPNEHACRLQQPSKFDKFRRSTRKHEGKTYSVIFGRVKDGDTWEEQAYRYAKDTWEAKDARAHCKSHEGSFSAAVADEKAVREYTSCADGACVRNDNNPLINPPTEVAAPAAVPEEEEPGEAAETPVQEAAEMYVAKLGELWDDTCVYIVDGEEVRERYPEFMGGGHGYCDDTDFIPVDEIWVEELDCPCEMQMALVHKVVEYIMQKYLGLDDMVAHMQTLTAEYVIRKIGLWEKEDEDEGENETTTESVDEAKHVTETLRSLVDNMQFLQAPKGLYDELPQIRLFSKPKL